MVMDSVNIKALISQGHKIRNGLKFVPPGIGVLRTFDVYRLADINIYYSWKERAIRFLQLYYPSDCQRFIKYSEDFEKHHYLPRFIANMIGVLDACEALPSEKAKDLEEDNIRNEEIAKVEELEQTYLTFFKAGNARINRPEAGIAFLAWHAAASILFEKWFYSTDEDYIKYQSIDTSGNSYSLSKEYKSIHTPYSKLMSRLKEGREIKRSIRKVELKKFDPTDNPNGNKVNIFISYSHADYQWLEELKKHLKVLSKYSGSVAYWEDTQLKGGDKWKQEIAEAIERANVAILLVSTDFLASDFISTDELPPLLVKAEKVGTRILPLIVAPCDFEMSELGVFQAINNPEKTLADLEGNKAAIDRVFLSLTKEIREII